MATLKGLIKIEGTLDGLTFYKGKNGYFIRTKGGISKERIQKDPAFIRTRENANEFGLAATAGKILRYALSTLIRNAKDNTLPSRLMSKMMLIKNQDTTSSRGQRNPAVGLTTPEGKRLLQDFDFNGNAILTQVLRADYSVNVTTGEIRIPGFVPGTQLNAPPGATHVTLKSALLNVDFTTEARDLKLSDPLNLRINATPKEVALAPIAVTGTGVTMILLQLSFFQEINGVQYPLNNGAFNTLNILRVV
ncbi:hypothetical protein [Leeuwenhoekiella marinoflava]|uniref:Uncharacterized protein n=2 Tax=Leeuwenhoekiella marinoflava TaxID=988 RepID=A0A4Q0PJM7_9FLAO|nr:hypothetical protein [Leeuwenhoekiella marinoflava]RXG26913.1 hypothetical protein DSL99_3223 [Leeuwenhoekiella marinoflava]SHF40995.1 hypothetical protein SAMN02745246_02426 [Leeuwenhoekiella marinoflava DSM 3653]